ncbi:MAG: apolipoprotein N-acyltransferase [Candidatus Aquicultor sp.]|nr:apolipoprotein N-acyltransferase [Candidatus Aquicultor sp.]
MVLSVNLLLAALTGILLALAFPYPSISLLAWVGLVPLFSALKRSDFKHAPLLGLLAGATFFATVLYWINIFGYIAWISLSLALSSAFVLFATATWLVMKRYAGIGKFIVIPALWAVFEFARSLGSWGFAWAYLGSTVEHPFLLGVASYVGEVGLGALIVLGNLVLFSLIDGEGLRGRMRQAAPGMAVAAVLLVPMLLFGQAASALFAPSSLDGKSPVMRAAIIQPNLAQDLKVDLTNNDAIKALYLAMTKEALKAEPEMIIWPESTLITRIDDEPEFLERVAKLLRPTKTTLVFGGVEGVEDRIYNTAFYLDADGRLHRYRKTHLVPFGEYVPMRPLIERVNNMAALVNDYTPGREYKVFKMGSAREFSTVICFESSQSDLVGRMVREGAEFLVIVTNDAWFGKTAAAEQHFRITRMRAAEYGIPIVQAANTGISGFINADGIIAKRSGLDKRIVLNEAVVLSGGATLYAKIGFIFPYIYLLVASVGLALAVWRRENA